MLLSSACTGRLGDHFRLAGQVSDSQPVYLDSSAAIDLGEQGLNIDAVAYDNSVSATTTWNLTALTLGATSSENWTNYVVKLIRVEYVSGSGSAVLDNAASTGLSAEIGAETVDADKRVIIMRPDVAVGASTHSITLTVAGTLVVKVFIGATQA